MTSTAFHCLILAVGVVCAIGTAIEDSRTPAPWNRKPSTEMATPAGRDVQAPCSDDDDAVDADRPQFWI